MFAGPNDHEEQNKCATYRIIKCIDIGKYLQKFNTTLTKIVWLKIFKPFCKVFFWQTCDGNDVTNKRNTASIGDDEIRSELEGMMVRSMDFKGVGCGNWKGERKWTLGQMRFMGKIHKVFGILGGKPICVGRETKILILGKIH